MADEINAIREAAESLVERARLGDQNAMAMLTRIGEESKAGSERAQLSYKLIMAFIKRNPSDGHGVQRAPRGENKNVYRLLRTAAKEKDVATFAGDVKELIPQSNDVMACGIVMADGQLMSRERIQAIAKLIGEEKERKLFYYCITCTDGRKIRLLVETIPAEFKSVIFTGRAVGMARKIQGIRSGKMALAKLSPMVAWELGE